MVASKTNIRKAGKLIGQRYADTIQNLSVMLYNVACAHAYSRGIIIADTKFEFGLDEETDEVMLIDEVLTPDSSRFWPEEDYKPGSSPPSFDKQFLRDWLKDQGLKGVSDVAMPADIQEKTALRYKEAFEKLTGDVFDEVVPSA